MRAEAELKALEQARAEKCAERQQTSSFIWEEARIRWISLGFRRNACDMRKALEGA
jgi:hypothetical protein